MSSTGGDTECRASPYDRSVTHFYFGSNWTFFT